MSASTEPRVKEKSFPSHVGSQDDWSWPREEDEEDDFTGETASVDEADKILEEVGRTQNSPHDKEISRLNSANNVTDLTKEGETQERKSCFADSSENGDSEADDAAGMQQEQQQLTEAFNRLPEGRRAEALKLLQEFAEKAEREPEWPLPENKAEMKARGIETYPEFKQRTGSTDGKQCLKENWGAYLKAFSKEVTGRTLARDHMCQADLGGKDGLDPQLLSRLKATCKTEELNSFLPSLPMLNKQKVDELTPEKIQEIQQIISLVYRHLEVA